MARGDRVRRCRGRARLTACCARVLRVAVATAPPRVRRTQILPGDAAAKLSMRRARAHVAAISLCRIAHASSVLRMCSRTPVCHVAIKRQRLSLARFLLSADKDAQRMYYKLPIKVLKRRLDASCDRSRRPSGRLATAWSQRGPWRRRVPNSRSDSRPREAPCNGGAEAS